MTINLLISVPEGLEDVSKYPALFEALVLEGWSDEDLEKLAGRNLIRVFKEVEKVNRYLLVLQLVAGLYG